MLTRELNSQELKFAAGGLGVSGPSRLPVAPQIVITSDTSARRTVIRRALNALNRREDFSAAFSNVNLDASKNRYAMMPDFDSLVPV